MAFLQWQQRECPRSKVTIGWKTHNGVNYTEKRRTQKRWLTVVKGAPTTCLFCCSSGQVRSSCGLLYTGTRVRRDGGAHTNLTTASSVAGEGLVTLASFPTITSSTWKILSRPLSCWLHAKIFIHKIEENIVIVSFHRGTTVDPTCSPRARQVALTQCWL